MHSDESNHFDLLISSETPMPPESEWLFNELKDVFWGDDIPQNEAALICMSKEKVIRWGELQNRMSGVIHSVQAYYAPGATLVLPLSEVDTDGDVAIRFFALLCAGYNVILPLSNTQEEWNSLLPLCPDAILRTPTTVVFSPVPTLFEIMGETNFPSPRFSNTSSLYWICTSGSTGEPKWIAHDSNRLLGIAAGYSAAGLLEESAMGGRSLCPLFSHSMGIRSVFLSLYTRHSSVMVSDSDWSTKPYTFVEWMRRFPPQVICCGPGLLSDIQQFVTLFPVLRRDVLPHLKTIISSGATFDKSLASKWPNIRIVNAFGMSETHQITTGLLSKDAPYTLGLPIPGVELAIEWEDNKKAMGRLWVSTQHMAIRESQHPAYKKWFYTGDWVECKDQRTLRYVGRAKDEFIQNGAGWKCSRQEVEKRHQNKPTLISHLEWISHPKSSGLLALAWLGKDAPSEDKSREIIREWFISKQLSWLQNGESPSIIRQFHVLSVGLLKGEPPRTRLGKIDRRKINLNNEWLLEQLTNPFIRHPQKIDIPDLYSPSGVLGRLFPRRSILLSALNLDWEYKSGNRDVLIGLRDGKEMAVLDLVGGFGCNLFGHAHPHIQEIAVRSIRDSIPILTQGSHHPSLIKLCLKLNHLISKSTGRNYIGCPANTGSEAVELAIKHSAFHRYIQHGESQNRLKQQFTHACPETLRRCLSQNEQQFKSQIPAVVVLQNAFHGKSIGTIKLLGDTEQREVFKHLNGMKSIELSTHGGEAAEQKLIQLIQSETRIHFSPELIDGKWEIKSKNISNILATIVEPILGEGGIHEVPIPWLKQIRKIPAPLIIDEIQSGMGRTGQFLASEGVIGDVYLLGKALCGGYAKMAFALIDRAHYHPLFDDHRSNTFNEAHFSAEIALGCLEVYDKEKIAERCQNGGAILIEKFLTLQKEYPDVLIGVRGKGFLIGVEFGFPNQPYTVALAALAKAGLGYLLSSYLLNQHQLRCLPTRSAPNVLRIEPSAYLTEEEMNKIIHGFKKACQALKHANLFELVVHLIEVPDSDKKRKLAELYMKKERGPKEFLIQNEPPAPHSTKVAFIHDPVNINLLLLADCPAFGLLNTTQRMKLLHRFEKLLEFSPMRSFAKNLCDDSVWMLGLTIPILPQSIEYLNRRNELSEIEKGLQKAVYAAENEGCEIVVLGAQTSILSRNATSLLTRNPNTILSSGNTFTAAVAIHSIQKNINLSNTASIGIIGALGNIGSALAAYFGALCSDFHGTLTLYGRAGSFKRLSKLRLKIQSLAQSEGRTIPMIECEESLEQIRKSKLIVLAVSSPSPLIYPSHFIESDDNILADISQPSVLDKGLKSQHPKLKTIEPAMVNLPGDSDFIMSAHSKPGEIFACAAEGVLSALHPHSHQLTGDISPVAVKELLEAGIKIGLLR